MFDMSEKQITLLNEKHLYVSWSLLLVIIGLTIALVKLMFQIEQLMPLIPAVSNMDKRVSIIEYQQGIINQK